VPRRLVSRVATQAVAVWRATIACFCFALLCAVRCSFPHLRRCVRGRGGLIAAWPGSPSLLRSTARLGLPLAGTVRSFTTTDRALGSGRCSVPVLPQCFRSPISSCSAPEGPLSATAAGQYRLIETAGDGGMGEVYMRNTCSSAGPVRHEFDPSDEVRDPRSPTSTSSRRFRRRPP